MYTVKFHTHFDGEYNPSDPYGESWTREFATRTAAIEFAETIDNGSLKDGRAFNIEVFDPSGVQVQSDQTDGAWDGIPVE